MTPIILLNFAKFIILLMTKQINKDLKGLSNWLNANKICRNVRQLKLSYLNLQKKKPT